MIDISKMFTVSFVFLYKLNSYMKAAWAITGAHTKLHAIVAALSIKLEQLQQLKIKDKSTPPGANKQTIIRTNQNYSFPSIFSTPVLIGIYYAQSKKTIEKNSNQNQIQSLWKQAMQWRWKLVMDP